jgi:hypothetical protein
MPRGSAFEPSLTEGWPKSPPASTSAFKPEPILAQDEYQRVLTLLEGRVELTERRRKSFHEIVEEPLHAFSRPAQWLLETIYKLQGDLTWSDSRAAILVFLKATNKFSMGTFQCDCKNIFFDSCR